MKIGRFRVNERAVSPVISTLLMVGIAVACSIVVYVWNIGLLGGLMGGGGAQVKQQLMFESYNWAQGASLTFTVRNVGSASVTIASLYISGTLQTGASWVPSNVINPGGTTGTRFTPFGSYTAGVAYTIKIVTTTGGIFTYKAVLGSTG